MQATLPNAFLEAEPSSECSTISVDNRGGAMIATRHLLALGRRRIGHIGGPPTWRAVHALADDHRPAPSELGRLAVRELLASINDEQALSEVRNLTLATELIVRHSAPAADTDYRRAGRDRLIGAGGE